jgi:hypothetical protein
MWLLLVMEKVFNAGAVCDPENKTTFEHKMGWPPAHLKTMSDVLSLNRAGGCPAFFFPVSAKRGQTTK